MSVRWPAVSQRAFVLGLLGVFVAVSVQYTLKVLDPRHGGRAGPRSCAGASSCCNSIAAKTSTPDSPIPNPPIMALMLRPLADLPPLVGALMWFYLKVAMSLIAFAAIFRVIETADVPFPPWASGSPCCSVCGRSSVTCPTATSTCSFCFSSPWLYAFRRGWDVAAGASWDSPSPARSRPRCSSSTSSGNGPGDCWPVCGDRAGALLRSDPGTFPRLGTKRRATYELDPADGHAVPGRRGRDVRPSEPVVARPRRRMLTASPSFSTYVNDVYTPVTSTTSWL